MKIRPVRSCFPTQAELGWGTRLDVALASRGLLRFVVSHVPESGHGAPAVCAVSELSGRILPLRVRMTVRIAEDECEGGQRAAEEARMNGLAHTVDVGQSAGV